MPRTLFSALLAVVAAFAPAGAAQASGGYYTFEGGSGRQRAEVRSALRASSFDWNVVPVQVTVHLGPGVRTHATPGHIYVDADLLNAGRFAWAMIQDEYAHQVDFFVFDDSARALLLGALGGRDWCYSEPGLQHSEYGCERFASMLVWAYWPSRHNAYRPSSPTDESAAMAPAEFRQLVSELLAARKPSPRMGAIQRLSGGRATSRRAKRVQIAKSRTRPARRRRATGIRLIVARP